MTSLADLIAGKWPGLPPVRRTVAKVASVARVTERKHATECLSVAKVATVARVDGLKMPENPPFFHKESNEIISLSCARESEKKREGFATVATLATLPATAPPSLAPSRDAATHRAWLIRHPDGQLFSHTFTPPATLPEVRAWYPGALSIEPEEDDAEGAEVSENFSDTPEGKEPAPPAELEALPDDRITCRECRHLTGARCQVAQRGGFSHRARRYEPDPEALHACYAFDPLPHDPDPRTGAARWPSLAWMARPGR